MKDLKILKLPMEENSIQASQSQPRAKRAGYLDSYYQSNVVESMHGFEKGDFLRSLGMVKPLQFTLDEVSDDYSFNDVEAKIFRATEYKLEGLLRKMHPESVGRCCHYWEVGFHECGKRVAKPAHWSYCGDKNHCPVCARSRASGQGAVWAHTLQNTFAYEFQMLTFTVPDYLSLEIVDQFKWNRKAIHDFLRGHVRTVMKKMYPQLSGYMAVIHEWHTKDPLSTPHLHIHVIFPCINVVEGTLVKFRAYQPDREKFLAWQTKVRRAWTNQFGETMLFVVHFSHCNYKKQGQLKRMCRYIVRHPILDINEWLLEQNLEELSEHQLFMYTWLTQSIDTHRLRSYGMLSNSKKNEFLKLCGSSLAEVKQDIKKSEEISKAHICWNCKKEIPARFWRTASIYYSEKPPPFRTLRYRDWKKFEGVGG